jgi:hypothetical protein
MRTPAAAGLRDSARTRAEFEDGWAGELIDFGAFGCVSCVLILKHVDVH